MKNKLTCPHCDKEITTLKMGYNAKQALVIIPILLLGFIPFLSIFFKSNSLASDDLDITSFDTRIDGKEMVVTGIINNLTDSAWTSVSVEVEFYDEGGNFIGESDDYIGSEIHSKANENFEVRFRNLPEVVLQGDASTKLKIAGGVCKNF
ncbi:FxLYD domain-containing protein [Candidatus Seribacter sulfatis]|uniref:FxLYD domain-containing protein n=1 Tax=Candidatus Seribacter sulfatis TaxID=3381756 RepID=UPI003899ABF7